MIFLPFWKGGNLFFFGRSNWTFHFNWDVWLVVLHYLYITTMLFYFWSKAKIAVALNHLTTCPKCRRHKWLQGFWLWFFLIKNTKLASKKELPSHSEMDRWTDFETKIPSGLWFFGPNLGCIDERNFSPKTHQWRRTRFFVYPIFGGKR